MLTYSDFLLRLLLSIVLGAAIGLERQRRQRMAGLRTNTLVALGAAIFIMLGLKLGGEGTVRMAPYIVSGIGFLGAGVIMKEGVHVRGPNTAATLWCSAAVGSLCGMGFGLEAATTTAAVLLAHTVLQAVGNRLDAHLVQPADVSRTHYLLQVACRPEVENHLRVLLLHTINSGVLQLNALQSVDADDQRSVAITVDITSAGREDQLLEKIVILFSLEQLVTMISWKILAQSED